MMENIDQMRKRHEGEIVQLQKNCKHKEISDWLDYAWAPGHFGGKVRVCENCGEIIEQQSPTLPKIEWTKSSEEEIWKCINENPD